MGGFGRLSALFVTAILATGCGGPSHSLDPSLIPVPMAHGGAGGGAGSGAGGGAGSGGGGGAGAGQSEGPPTLPGPADGSPYLGPFKVNEVIGDATVTGTVCSLDRPFAIDVRTSKVAFRMQLTPQGPASGTAAYAYAIASLGESDTATGGYSVGAPDNLGARPLNLSLRDRTVFRGVDTEVPIAETLHLKPAPDPGCP